MAAGSNPVRSAVPQPRAHTVKGTVVHGRYLGEGASRLPGSPPCGRTSSTEVLADHRRRYEPCAAPASVRTAARSADRRRARRESRSRAVPPAAARMLLQQAMAWPAACEHVPHHVATPSYDLQQLLLAELALHRWQPFFNAGDARAVPESGTTDDRRPRAAVRRPQMRDRSRGDWLQANGLRMCPANPWTRDIEVSPPTAPRSLTP